MDFIADPKAWEQELQEFFTERSPVFFDESDYQLVRAYDCRSTEVPSSFSQGIRTVFAMVFDSKGQILLVDHPKRGWEICGGHLTLDEVKKQDIEGALHREAVEESGYSIQDPQLGFLVWVTNKTESSNKELNCPYPEHALMAYFNCLALEKVSDQLDDDIKGAKFFSIESALEELRSRNRSILKAFVDSK